MVKKISLTAFFILLFLSTYRIFLSNIIDVDIWWHIMLGKGLVNFNIDYSDWYWTDTVNNILNLRFTALGDVIFYFVYDGMGCSGLVILRTFCLLSGCLFLYLLSDKKPTFDKLLILILLIIGTYQKQLIRNSMFVLILFPCVLYLIHNKKYLFTSLVLILWSFLHGSYTFGFLIVCVIILSDLKKHKNILKIWIPLLIVFCIISYNNPSTKSMISTNTIKKIVKADNINQTFFSPGKHASVDYYSPFKRDMIYISFAYALALLVVIFVKPKIKHLIPFLCVCFMGLGYVRFVGYIPIISAYVYFVSEKRYVNKNIWLISCILLITYINIDKIDYLNYTRKKIINHGTGSGILQKSPLNFPDLVAEVALEKYKDEDTFNMIESGGYLLLKWYPCKKVYIDTYWAAHKSSFIDEYIYYCKNPDKIPCNSAILPIAQYDIIVNFLKNKWYIDTIDQGSVLFSRNKTEPRLHITKEDSRKMSDEHKNIVNRVLLLFNKKLI